MSPSDILNSLQIGNFKHVYYIGSLQRGITIYKQQVRALNLIYSLDSLDTFKENKRIAIIGGGISAVTASAAALLLGYEVHLFESKPILLHLQTGCRTRWVHPNIYDWPKEGSEFPYARLPVLNWKAGYSSDVAVSILEEYYKITRVYGDRYRECLGAKFHAIDPAEKLIHLSDSNNKYHKNSYLKYDAIIYATGFGLEIPSSVKPKNNFLNETNSYWRNDDLDQPYLDSKGQGVRKIVISGTGDGALIDLLRGTLKNFHQGRLIDDLLDCCEENDRERLLFAINEIKIECDAKSDLSLLYNKFERLPAKLLISMKEYISDQRRLDTSVTLLGKDKEIGEIFSTRKMSTFNAFVAFLLYSTKSFTYYGFRNSEIKNGSITIQLLDKNKVPSTIKIPFDSYIERHGPSTVLKDSLKNLGVEKLEFRDSVDTSIRIWDAGWPKKNNIKSAEFVPSTIKAITTTFVEVVGNNLVHLHKDPNPSFRLTFDRFIEINDEMYFQQVCRYAGTATSGSRDTIGRIFPARSGIVGYTARQGEPVLLIRKDDFEKTVEMMEINKLDANPIRPSLKSMFCIPLFSNVNDEFVVNCVLYLDSSQEDFFSDEIIRLIVSSCQGFVRNLEKMIDNQEFRVNSGAFKGIKPSEKYEELSFSSLKVGRQITNNFDMIAFTKIKSLDFYE